MRTRIISALVGVPVVLLAILSGLPGIAVLAILAGVIAGTELDQLMRSAPASAAAAGTGSGSEAGSANRFRLGGVRIVSLVAGPTIMAVVGIWMLSQGRVTGSQFPIILAIIFALVLQLRGMATLGLANRRSNSGNSSSQWVYWIFAGYVGIVLAHAPVLVDQPQGRELILLAIITTFAIDTMALIIGLSFGRNKLAPKISPKKSWEGAIAGVVTGAVAAVIIDGLFNIGFSTLAAGVLGAVMGVVAVLGDLYESWIKRRSGVKDSGSIVPGHGGILDRLDSVIPNLAVVYWAALWSAS